MFNKTILRIISQLCRAARKVSPDWSQKTMFGGQLVTSHPSSCYMTLISEQGRVKICKYSQSPFNQLSFSMLSPFLPLKTGLNYTRKVVDQGRILNPEFEQLVLTHAATPVNYLFINIYNNNAPIL